MRHSNHKINMTVSKRAMKNKFVDASAEAKKLRHEKAELGNLLRSEFKYSKKKCRKLLKSSLEKAANHRQIHKTKMKKKYTHCESKMLKSKREHISEIFPWKSGIF